MKLLLIVFVLAVMVSCDESDRDYQCLQSSQKIDDMYLSCERALYEKSTSCYEEVLTYKNSVNAKLKSFEVKLTKDQWDEIENANIITPAKDVDESIFNRRPE